MQREQKGQQSIRDTIHLLSSLLAECKIPRVSSECFRRAKFDQEAAAKELWKLTFHTMQAIQFLERDFCGETLDKINFHSFTASNFPAARAILCHYLFKLNYEREEFFITGSVGSRELLLAFAWLLNRTSFFAKLTKHYLRLADTTSIPLKPSTRHLIEQVIENNRAIESDMKKVITTITQKDTSPNEISSEVLDKLVWLKGRLDYKWKALYRSSHAYQALADKIHKSTAGKVSSLARRPDGTKGHLSVHEVFLLRYPNQMKAFLNKLAHCVSVLQKLIQWQDCAPLFWQWMESVVDLQEKAKLEMCEDGNNAPPIKKLDDVKDLAAKVCVLQEEFGRLLEKNRPHIDRIGHLWRHRSRTLSYMDVNSEECSIREQGEFEYPITARTGDATSEMVEQQKLRSIDVAPVVEQLTSVDSVRYVHTANAKRHSHQAFPTLGQMQQEADDQLVKALHDYLQAIRHELRTLDTAIEEQKVAIRNQLESLEQKLPPTVYKMDLQLS